MLKRNFPAREVFAGVAVIAEQVTEPGNFVEWISADPVTGSNVRISKSGAFYDTERKELEPLGQEILPTQPPAQPLPSTENVTFSAQEPEWQCKAAEAMYAKSFHKKPIHCQKGNCFLTTDFQKV